MPSGFKPLFPWPQIWRILFCSEAISVVLQAAQDAVPEVSTPFRTAHSIVGASEPMPTKQIQPTASKAPSQVDAVQEGSRKRSLDLMNKEPIEPRTALLSERSKSIAHSSKEQSQAEAKQDTSKSSKPLSRLSAVLKGPFQIFGASTLTAMLHAHACRSADAEPQSSTFLKSCSCVLAAQCIHRSKLRPPDTTSARDWEPRGLDVDGPC